MPLQNQWDKIGIGAAALALATWSKIRFMSRTDCIREHSACEKRICKTLDEHGNALKEIYTEMRAAREHQGRVEQYMQMVKREIVD